jgi:hypothetical protein
MGVIYGRMRSGRKLVAAVAALTAVAAAPALGASGLKLTKVTQPPEEARAGDEVVIKATVRNRGTDARRGVLTMTLTGGPGEYGVPRRIVRIRTGPVGAGAFKRYRVRFTVPVALNDGRYRIRTCLKTSGTQRCRVSRAMRVTAL